jgi:hypothetical protein
VGKRPADYDKRALKQGTKVEMEHTTDADVAREIAMDHLEEHPGYYAKLKVMEHGLEREKKTRKACDECSTLHDVSFGSQVKRQIPKKFRKSKENPVSDFNDFFKAARQSKSENPPWAKPGERVNRGPGRAADCGIHRRVTPSIDVSGGVPAHLIAPTSRQIDRAEALHRMATTKPKASGEKSLGDFSDFFKASKKEVKHPGEKGGKFYYDSKGKVHYGVKPMQAAKTQKKDEKPPKSLRPRWYVGHAKGGVKTPFKASKTPTQKTHGHLYMAVTGPFKTGRGAHTWAHAPVGMTQTHAENAAKQQASLRAKKSTAAENTLAKGYFAHGMYENVWGYQNSLGGLQ